jgi:hypothetical protein
MALHCSGLSRMPPLGVGICYCWAAALLPQSAAGPSAAPAPSIASPLPAFWTAEQERLAAEIDASSPPRRSTASAVFVSGTTKAASAATGQPT